MFAVNAFEMSNNHNFIVPFYKSLPDMWNSKPPLQIWLQVLCIKLIGFNELAIRLPSALASSGSALLLFFFFKKRASLVFALTVFLVFISSTGVSTFHTGRTGDSDALLSFFMLCYCIAFYKWLFENNNRSILYFFLFLILAVLTKSVAALLFTPALLFLVLYYKKTTSLLTNKWFYVGLFPFIIIAIGYFLLRDLHQSGYISYVLQNDLGRLHKVIELHQEPFDFYLIRLFEVRFLWFILVIPGAFALWITKKTKVYAVFLTSIFISYFLIISYSTTKLEWYDLPLFPILSVFSAYLLFLCMTKIKEYNKTVNLYVVVCLVFVLPVYFSCRTSYKSEIYGDDKKFEVLTEYAFKNHKNNSLNGTIFLMNGYDRALYFYKYKMNSKGLNFKVVNSIDSIFVTNTIIVANDSLKRCLTTKYNLQVIDSINSALKVNIVSLK
jgi:4-amino-4-deoxy-L-arabinose transferase-like glycosyltransferase